MEFGEVMTHTTMLLHLAAAELSSGNAREEGRGEREPAWVARKEEGKERAAPPRRGQTQLFSPPAQAGGADLQQLQT